MELDMSFKAEWPLRQGDVVGFWDWNKREPLSRFGVIITADCDIANGRVDQHLVYLRTIPQVDYIDIFWSRSKLEKACDKVFQDVVPLINKLRRIADDEAKDLSRQDVESWIATSSIDEIRQTINPSNPDDRVKLINNLDRARKTIDLASVPAGSACLDRLIAAGGQDRPKLLKQAANELGGSRDEIFFLSGITDATDQVGYYVLLDQIGAVPRNQITHSVTELKQGQKSAYRFGRLSNTYKYALAQRFAYLFQRIGLPNDHTQRHVSALRSLNMSCAESAESRP